MTLSVRAIVSALLVVPIWFAMAAKLAALRNRRERPAVLFLGSLVALGLAMTADREAPYIALSHLLGIQNAGYWISYMLGLITCWAGTTLLLETWDPDRARRQARLRAWLAWAAALALSVAFFAGPAGYPTATVIQHSAPPDLGTVWYRLLTGVVYTIVVAEVGFLSWRIAGTTTGAEPFRWGLRLVTVGCVLAGVRLFGEQVVFTVGYRLELPVPGADSVSIWGLNAVAMAGAALIGAGPALPAVVRGGGAVREWWEARRRLTALRYLSAALSPIAPRWYDDSSSFRRRVTAWLRPEDLLYGRVIELRDAYLVLHPYRSSDFEDRARDELAAVVDREDDLAAATEAAGLHHALDRYARGEDCLRPPETVGLVAASIDAEAAHLGRVSEWAERYDLTGSTSADGLAGAERST